MEKLTGKQKIIIKTACFEYYEILKNPLIEDSDVENTKQILYSISVSSEHTFLSQVKAHKNLIINALNVLYAKTERIFELLYEKADSKISDVFQNKMIEILELKKII